MKAKKIFWVLPCLTLLFATTVSSCSENNDDHPQSEKKHHFLMSAQSDNSFFITSFENFNEGTSVSYDKAITLPTGTTPKLTPSHAQAADNLSCSIRAQ